jgi:hypothetical protein
MHSRMLLLYELSTDAGQSPRGVTHLDQHTQVTQQCYMESTSISLSDWDQADGMNDWQHAPKGCKLSCSTRLHGISCSRTAANRSVATKAGGTQHQSPVTVGSMLHQKCAQGLLQNLKHRQPLCNTKGVLRISC